MHSTSPLNCEDVRFVEKALLAKNYTILYYICSSLGFWTIFIKCTKKREFGKNDQAKTCIFTNANYQKYAEKY